MNFVYISPSFPKNFYQFWNRLKLNGVTVLAIADTPYDQLSEELKNSIDDYYQVYSMENFLDPILLQQLYPYKYHV